MKVTAQKIVFFLFLLLPAFLIQIAAQSGLFLEYFENIRAYLPVYLIVLLFLKLSSIVYPPLPGALFTVSSIPIIGWQLAYFIDVAGSCLGAIIAYLLGKRYGYTILTKVLGQNLTQKVIAIKLKPRNQIEAAFVLRFAAGGILSDGLAWGASLIGFKLLPFMIGYLTSHILITLPIFYFIGVSISFDSWLLFLLATLTAWLLLFKFKGRYFE